MNLLTRCALRSLVINKGFALLATLPIFLSGCGGGSGTGSTLTGNTMVTVLATSTANDQLSQFPVTLGSLTLTTTNGTSVQLLPTPVGVEYIHLNGTVEPLSTVSIPQGTYTTAAATFGKAYSFPVCVGLTAGGLLTDGALNSAASNTLTLNLPAPITITGEAMGLVLNLQVSQSAPFNGDCEQNLTNNVPVNPVFNLTPLQIASTPSGSANGKALNIEGEIASIHGSGESITVNGTYGYNLLSPPNWQVTLNSKTSLVGVRDASKLAAGMPVAMDLALQGDGSLLATRVSIYDANTTNLSLSSGLATQVFTSLPRATTLVAQSEGSGITTMSDIFDLRNTTFQISGAFSNLGNLPFSAQFNLSNLVPGQNVYVTTHASLMAGPSPSPLTTMMLMPQTINGKVSAMSSDGGFTTYTVTLAPYNLFPNLASQLGPGTALQNPSTIVVYADSNTQMLSGGPVAVGSTFRFNGLVFNDNGTLRMDCAQINDGVTE